MTNNKQQTAVDIAFEKLANQGLLITRDYKNLRAYIEFKEMEKEQIMKAYNEDTWWVHQKNKKFNNAEDYYEEIYGGCK